MRYEALKESYFWKEYEYDLVGAVEVEASGYLAELERLQKVAEKRGYKPIQRNSLPFRESVELTKKFQPEDPTNPKKEFARDFRLSLAEKLGLETAQDLERIKIFTCVDGPLDAHGIDFFVSFIANHGKEKEYILTFDITKNPNKDASPKADFLIGPNIPDRGDSGFNEEEYLKIIDEYADKSVACLRERIECDKRKDVRIRQAA